MTTKHFIANKGDRVFYLGKPSKIISLGWCSYTNQYMYTVKELRPPYYQIQGVGSLHGCLSHKKQLKTIKNGIHR